MALIIKGVIQCTEGADSCNDLLEIRPEEYFGVKPLKWETGWDSADTGDMTPPQNFSWAGFAFEGFIPSSIIKLALSTPDNEWAIYDIEVTEIDKGFMEMLKRKCAGDIPQVSDADKISGEIFLEETLVTEQITIKKNGEVIWSQESKVKVVNGKVDTEKVLFLG